MDREERRVWLLAIDRAIWGAISSGDVEAELFFSVWWFDLFMGGDWPGPY